ncbi:MAG: HAMP domain-containing sensor histidine kinase, partial [Roseibium sp.]
MDGDQDQNHEIALLAHDLRTPLSAMKLTAELIGVEKLSPVQVERLKLLIRSIDALSDMTGALLLTSETGDRAPELSAIAADTAELFRAPAEAKGLGYKVEIEASKIRLEPVRAGALRRVMTTLLDNAVKYTDAGKISISFEILPGKGETPAEVRLAVTDTGPGIDPMERRRLFKPYVRGTAGKARSHGSGLGL